MSPLKRQRRRTPARKRARPTARPVEQEKEPELTLDMLSELKDDSFDIGPVRSSGNPAPMIRPREI